RGSGPTRRCDATPATRASSWNVCTCSPGRTAPPATGARPPPWPAPTTTSSGVSPNWPNRKNWNVFAPTWTATKSRRSSTSRPDRPWGRPTVSCSSCVWRTGRCPRRTRPRSYGPGRPSTSRCEWSELRFDRRDRHGLAEHPQGCVLQGVRKCPQGLWPAIEGRHEVVDGAHTQTGAAHQPSHVLCGEGPAGRQPLVHRPHPREEGCGQRRAVSVAPQHPVRLEREPPVRRGQGESTARLQDPVDLRERFLQLFQVLDLVERRDPVEGVGVEGQGVRGHLVHTDPAFVLRAGEPFREYFEPCGFGVDRVHAYVTLDESHRVDAFAASHVEQSVSVGW